MHRPVFATSILFTCAALLCLQSCSPEPDPGFEEGTWAAAHRAQIELDCDRRFVCAQGMHTHLTEQAYENCLAEQATKLNGVTPEKQNLQFNFELSLSRCPGDDACRYVECADSGFQSFGQRQLPKVQYTCQQKVQCAIDNRNLANDPTVAYESCVLDSVIALDTFTQAAQTTFQDTFFPCMPMTSCAFVICFGH